MQTPRTLTVTRSRLRIVLSAGVLLLPLCLVPAAHAFVCGNGIIEPGETCDDGNTVSGDTCSATCQFEGCPMTGTWDARSNLGIHMLFSLAEDVSGNITGAVHTVGYPPITGTRVGPSVELYITGPYQGTQVFQQCDSLSVIGFPNLTLTRTSLSYCGDGVLNPGEACDDGNFDEGDGCSTSCTIEVCGNGVVDAGEACDDGNQVNGDACENDCTRPRCGNGIIDATEQCDDGNLVDGDGCDHSCGIPGCPNNVVDPGEQCDDGNVIDNDGCARNCRLPGCGNGIRETGEQCDDGNLTNGDGCESNCTVGPASTTTSTMPPVTTTSTVTTTTSSTSTSVAPCSDADGDGEADATDRCPGTPPSEPVDDSGCSIAQFCAGFTSTTPAGARACKHADWKNDEPLMRRSQADCTIDHGAPGLADDRCVPRP